MLKTNLKLLILLEGCVLNKIKICGLSRIHDILAVNEYIPDYIGFVFTESKRQVSYSKAMELFNVLNKDIGVVGVFVNENMDRLVNICNSGILDAIQLHGDETNEYIMKLKTHINIPIIKSIRVKDATSLKNVDEITSDFILFDSCIDSCYGGSGNHFDWSLIPKILDKQFFLAGGINMANIQSAMSTGAYCIDISTGVETNGIKDQDKIEKTIGIIRGMNQ